MGNFTKGANPKFLLRILKPMEWPDYFPDNCPFEDAKEPSFKVYYLVKNNPPCAEDFRSLHERRPDSKFDNSALECQSCGISVFTDIEGIDLAKKISSGFRRMKTAAGTLTPDLGLIKNTKSQRTGDSHHTFWFPKNSKPWIVFEVID